MRHVNAVDVERQGRRLRTFGAGEDGEVDELDALMRMNDLVIDQRDQILVVDDLLAVGEVLEADERVVQCVFPEFIAELAQLVLEGVASRNACPSPARSC